MVRNIWSSIYIYSVVRFRSNIPTPPSPTVLVFFSSKPHGDYKQPYFKMNLSQQELSWHFFGGKIGDTVTAETVADTVQTNAEFFDAKMKKSIFSRMHFDASSVLSVYLVGCRSNPKQEKNKTIYYLGPCITSNKHSSSIVCSRCPRLGECCVFRPDFGCCAHRKAGPNIFFSHFQPFFFFSNLLQ